MDNQSSALYMMFQCDQCLAQNNSYNAYKLFTKLNRVKKQMSAFPPITKHVIIDQQLIQFLPNLIFHYYYLL